MNNTDLIKKTFCRDAVRTATLIDDKFPTYTHLLAGKAPAYTEAAKAGILYQACKKRDILCDIENDVEKLKGPQFEQIRKSDLIVLDYHLRAGDDASDALQFLCRLADSKHFNLVVLYTRETNLRRVWLRAASTLKQGWRHAAEIFGENTALFDRWEGLQDAKQLPQVPEEVLLAYVSNGMKKMPAGSDTGLRKELDDLGVPKGEQTNFLEALFETELLRVFSDSKVNLKGPPRTLAGKATLGQIPWLHCGTIFVAMMSKQPEPEGDICNTDDPEGVFNCIECALTDWNPNIIQILASEIQNTLEQKALAYDHTALDEPAVQAGWLYHLMKEAARSPGESQNVTIALGELYSRVFETIRRNFEVKGNLPTIGFALLEYLARAQQPGSKQDKELAEIASNLASPNTKLQPSDILHALNRYLSSEPFRSTYVTTGTIFTSAQVDTWWVCVSPACDMVPRQPSDLRSWQRDLHPIRPMIALRLEPITVPAALKEAEHCRAVFVNFDGTRHAFRMCEGNTGQPRTELFLLVNEGRITEDNRRLSFSGNRIVIATDSKTPSLKSAVFLAIAQLRESYAGRLLQQTGHHTSRIGVDFVKFAVD